VSNHIDRLTLKGHSDQVHAIAFTPVGRALVSGSQDLTLKLWRAASEGDISGH